MSAAQDPSTPRTSLTSPGFRPGGEFIAQPLRLAIEYVPIDCVKSYASNPREHSKSQIAKIAESIRAFGVVLPCLLEQDDVLIAGHAVVEAARLAGVSELPIVRIAHLAPPQVKALRIALNRLAELSEWDEQTLALEFKAILAFDAEIDLSFDAEVTGFSFAEIDRFVQEPGPGDKEVDPDDAMPEENDTEPTSRVGDLWQVGPHLLLNDDALQPESFNVLMDGERASFVCADDPYNVPIRNHVSGRGDAREFVMASGEMSPEAFTGFLTTIFRNLAAVSTPGSLHLHFMDWRHVSEMMAAGSTAYTELKNLLVWVKPVGGMGSHWRSRHELVFAWKSGDAPHINNVQLGRFGRNRTNVLEHPGVNSLGAAARDAELAMHATPKPVSLIRELILDCSNPNDLVLDCFCGSGTILIAASRTGRRARAMELDPRYVDVAVKRWQAWSGQEARHAQTGLTFAEMARQRALETTSAASGDAAADENDRRMDPAGDTARSTTKTPPGSFVQGTAPVRSRQRAVA